MPKQVNAKTVPPPPALPVFVVRGQRVILDADLAAIYGVPTKVFNQAIKRNQERFPEDFAFQLTVAETATCLSCRRTATLRRSRRWREVRKGRPHLELKKISIMVGASARGGYNNGRQR